MARKEPHERLREARQKAGFEHIADAARRFTSINQNTLTAHEAGRRPGGLRKEAEKYARAFNVTAGWILFEEGKGPARPSVDNTGETEELPDQKLLELSIKFVLHGRDEDPALQARRVVGVYRALIEAQQRGETITEQRMPVILADALERPPDDPSD